ncbi:MAG: nitrite reductase small subunit NirD [Porticoccaceae bacterium]
MSSVIHTEPVHSKSVPDAPRWVEVCALDDLPFDAGVAALLDEGLSSECQIALFRIEDSTEIYAVANRDPFSRANVLARGILCHIQGEPAVASPVLKQHFSLRDGRCFEDASVRIATYAALVRDGRVLVAASTGEC